MTSTSTSTTTSEQEELKTPLLPQQQQDDNDEDDDDEPQRKVFKESRHFAIMGFVGLIVGFIIEAFKIQCILSFQPQQQQQQQQQPYSSTESSMSSLSLSISPSMQISESWYPFWSRIDIILYNIFLVIHSITKLYQAKQQQQQQQQQPKQGRRQGSDSVMTLAQYHLLLIQSTGLLLGYALAACTFLSTVNINISMILPLFLLFGMNWIICTIDYLILKQLGNKQDYNAPLSSSSSSSSSCSTTDGLVKSIVMDRCTTATTAAAVTDVECLV